MLLNAGTNCTVTSPPYVRSSFFKRFKIVRASDVGQVVPYPCHSCHFVPFQMCECDRRHAPCDAVRSPAQASLPVPRLLRSSVLRLPRLPIFLVQHFNWPSETAPIGPRSTAHITENDHREMWVGRLSCPEER